MLNEVDEKRAAESEENRGWLVVLLTSKIFRAGFLVALFLVVAGVALQSFLALTADQRRGSTVKTLAGLCAVILSQQQTIDHLALQEQESNQFLSTVRQLFIAQNDPAARDIFLKQLKEQEDRSLAERSGGVAPTPPTLLTCDELVKVSMSSSTQQPVRIVTWLIKP